jgi:hypothetical protein
MLEPMPSSYERKLARSWAKRSPERAVPEADDAWAGEDALWLTADERTLRRERAPGLLDDWDPERQRRFMRMLLGATLVGAVMWVVIGLLVYHFLFR